MADNDKDSYTNNKRANGSFLGQCQHPLLLVFGNNGLFFPCINNLALREESEEEEYDKENNHSKVEWLNYNSPVCTQ